MVVFRRRGADATRPALAVILSVLLVLSVSVPAGCGWGRPAEREGGTLVLAVPAGLPVLDPHRAVEPHPVYAALYDTLLTRTPELELSSGLAAEWKVLEGGCEVVLTLRQGVCFHDGTPLDGPAVAKNIERVTGGSPEEFPVQALLGPLREVNAAELQVTLSYDRPFPPVWQALADPRLGIVSPAAFDPAREQAPAPGAPGQGDSPAMAGTGPYVVSACGEERIVLERNPQYAWPPGPVHNRGRAYPERLEVVAAAAGRESPAGREDPAALAGEGAGATWDILWWPAGSGLPEAIEEVTADWRRYAYGGGRIVYLTLKAASPPFDDPLVRQAVLAAVDRPAVLAAAPWPSLPALGVLPSAQGGPAGCVPPQDLETAERMLDAAGWTRDEDGRRRKDGELLELRLATYEDYPAFGDLAAAVCADLEAAGFSCRVVAVRPQGDPALLPHGPNGWLLYYQWPDPDVLYYLFHSSQVGRANRAGYANRSVDSLLEAARNEIDPGVRMGMYQEAQAFILGDGYVLPLFESRGEVRISSRIVGFRAWPDGRLLLHDVYLRQSP